MLSNLESLKLELTNRSSAPSNHRLLELRNLIINALYSTGSFLTCLSDATDSPNIQAFSILAILRTERRMSGVGFVELGDKLVQNAYEQLISMSLGDRNVRLMAYENMLMQSVSDEPAKIFIANPTLENAKTLMNSVYDFMAAEAFLVASSRRKFMNGRYLEYLYRAQNVGWTSDHLE